MPPEGIINYKAIYTVAMDYVSNDDNVAEYSL